MRLRNDEMAAMADACIPHLRDGGLLGYACARNYRMLTTASLEYSAMRDDLVRRYGEKEYDADGRETGATITKDSPNWTKLTDALADFAGIEHEVEVFAVAASALVGILSGEEMLRIGWMLDWEA